ncbi:hypothetical protein BLA29_000452 [Euroglyphus maynei]|uniref:Uncharacterized protein n=1 Tax=Euroglyphus maynei TaxID=6958 RepID=A0A1Y3BC90_EURMA|nr:hypothetical protein BLA29_000452 [Euroglyphus maynei]
MWHSFSNNDNQDDESVETLVPKLRQTKIPFLREKLQIIYEQLLFLQADCSRTEIFEQQLNDLSRQLSNYRTELSQKYSTMMAMFDELSNVIKDSNPLRISTERPILHPSNIRMCLDDQIRYKLRRLPAIVRGYLVRRLLATGKIRNLRRTIRDTSAILVNFKKNLQTDNDGRLMVTEQDVLFHRQLCAQLEKSCHEFYRSFFQLSLAKQMELIRNDREHRLNRFDSTTSQYSTSSSLFSSSSSLSGQTNRKKIERKF